MTITEHRSWVQLQLLQATTGELRYRYISLQRIRRCDKRALMQLSTRRNRCAGVAAIPHLPAAGCSNASAAAEASMVISPVMLVAEEVPIAKVKPSPKPARLVVREGKSYAPRPRSASIPRSALKRRSRYGGQTPSRPGSPSHQYEEDDAPPLPSPPPNRALPPTPPASGSEKPNRAKFRTTADAEKDLPSLPSDKIISELKETTPHIASLNLLQCRSPQPATAATRLAHFSTAFIHRIGSFLPRLLCALAF